MAEKIYWHTITTRVDIDTGEVIDNKLKNEYETIKQIEKTIKYEQREHHTDGYIKLTIGVRRKKQLKLW